MLYIKSMQTAPQETKAQNIEYDSNKCHKLQKIMSIFAVIFVESQSITYMYANTWMFLLPSILLPRDVSVEMANSPN